MGFGALFSFLKPKENKSSQIPNLNSKSSDIPMPNDSFGSQGFGSQMPMPQGSQGSKPAGLNDLPDFPDFPDFSSSKSDNLFPAPSANVEPPKAIPQPMQASPSSRSSSFSGFDFDKLSAAIPEQPVPAVKKPVKSINAKLDDYETYNNEKFIGVAPEEDSEHNHFVNIHDYRQTLEFVDTMKDNVSAFENSSMQLHDLSSNSALLEENFKKTIEDIQRKLVFLDKTLFETHAE